LFVVTLDAGKTILKTYPLRRLGTQRKTGTTSIIVTAMSDDFSQTRLGSHGGRRTPGQQSDNVTLRARGNSRHYYIARLRRDGLHDLADAVESGKISAFAIAVQLGWAKRPRTLHGEDCNQARKRAIDIRALIA